MRSTYHTVWSLDADEVHAIAAIVQDVVQLERAQVEHRRIARGQRAQDAARVKGQVAIASFTFLQPTRRVECERKGSSDALYPYTPM